MRGKFLMAREMWMKHFRSRVVWTAVLLLAGMLPSAWGYAMLSKSGQFVVHSSRLGTPSLAQLVATTNRPSLQLQPDTLLVTAERVKNRVLHTLGLQDRWQGKINLWLVPANQRVDYIPVHCTHFTDGWQYSLHVPDRLKGPVLVRAIVEAVLLEMAHRIPGPTNPEIPIWLAEGLTGQLLAMPGPDLVVRQNSLLSKQRGRGQEIGVLLPTSHSIRTGNYWVKLDKTFGHRRPLTYNELSLPTSADLTEPGLDFYRASAQVFLSHLERLPGGRQDLVLMIGNLTRALNWQTAFQRAFARYFRHPIDVEQWWALVAMQYSDSFTPSAWSAARSLAKLTEVLAVTAQVKDSPNQPSRRERFSLQQVIAGWAPSQQIPLLRQRVSDLQLVRNRSVPVVAALAKDYQQTLDNYLNQQARQVGQPQVRGLLAASRSVLVRETLRRLTALDQRRAQMGPVTGAAKSSNPQTPAAVSTAAKRVIRVQQ